MCASATSTSACNDDPAIDDDADEDDDEEEEDEELWSVEEGVLVRESARLMLELPPRADAIGTV